MIVTRRRPATTLAPPALLAIACGALAAIPAGAQDGTARAPGDIARDCGVTDRLSIVWRRGQDSRAIRHDIFSRTEPGAPADWHGWTAIDAEPRYTFDDLGLAGREFRIALKDSTGGALRAWSAWQKPGCAPGTAQSTPSSANATPDDEGSRGPDERCGADGSTHLSWGAVAGTRRYHLYRQDPNGSVWLRDVPGGETRTTLAPGVLGENDRVQVDIEFDDGSRRYAHTFADGCPTRTPAAARPAPNATPAAVDRTATDGRARPPARIANDPSGWTRHPWSHDFDVASDLDRWHAPHRLGGRDPDDRHVGKQRRERAGGPLVSNLEAFAEVARVDTASGHLVMRSLFSEREEHDSRGIQQGEARIPFLVSAAAFDVLDRDGRRVDWTTRYPYRCADAEGASIRTPCDFVIDPREKDWYIEIRASFEGATEAFKSWWAFWLYPRNRAYDGDVDTGMEVDVLEYVPYVTPDGFHTALFRRRDETLRPEGRAFAARGTDAFLRRTNADYDACRRADTCPPIRLDEGFHTIGIAYSRSGYAFYLDGYRYWEVDDPGWITKEPRLALRLTWEKDEGGIIDDTDGNGTLDYRDDAIGGGPRDGVPDWRQSPLRTGLSYGPWNQGFATRVMYDRDCLVRVVDGPKRDSFAGGQYTFDVARGRYGVRADNLEIVEGSCSPKRHATHHPPSEVRVDYVHVYTRD